jgi:hypothetical protein
MLFGNPDPRLQMGAEPIPGIGTGRAAGGLLVLAMLTGVIGLRADADEVDQAVERGVAYLIEQQNDDGSLGYLDHGRGKRRDKNENAMTSLMLLAMAAVGHQPTDPTSKGRAMTRALDFILRDDRQDDDGYYGKVDGSRMYGHGMTTLMLSEMLGMGVTEEQDRLIRRRLAKALELTLRAQNKNKRDRYYGGWRYTPGSRDADMSLTCWQLMSLRSAKNAGWDISPEAIERATEFLLKCYDGRKKQFGYQPGNGHRYSDTAMALLSLQVCGKYDDKAVRESSDWLLQYDLNPKESWFYYGTYYFAQGMYQRGGEHADHARTQVEQIMLREQHKNGSWKGRGQESNDVYGTSMALLALSVRYHFLPIYQR